MPRPQPVRRRLRPAALLLTAAAVAACGGDGGPSAPDSGSALLVGRWTGQTAAHGLDLQVTKDSTQRQCYGEWVPNSLGKCYDVAVRARGTYHDRATGEAFALPGLASQPYGDATVELVLFERLPGPTRYLFRGRLAGSSAMSGWLVRYPTCSAVTGCPAGGGPDSAAMALERR